MRRFVFIASILFISFQSIAQTAPYRKKVIHKVTNVLVEEYDLVDSASTVKNGYYARYYTDGKVRKTGSFANNLRSGVWSFYDDNDKLVQRYNYTTGMGLFVPPDTIATYYLKMAGVDTNFYSTLQSPPLFIGGIVELRDFIGQNLRYPTIAKQSGITGNVVVTFFVNSNGYIETPKIVKPLGYGCEDEVLRVVNLLPRFIPARRQGSDTRQQYYMVFTFESKK